MSRCVWRAILEVVHRLDVERIGHRNRKSGLIDPDRKDVVPPRELEGYQVEGSGVHDVACWIEAGMAELARKCIQEVALADQTSTAEDLTQTLPGLALFEQR
jgi:hypothetical protein